MIHLENVHFAYPGGLGPDTERPALLDVSLKAQAGELLCLAGENGSGKSTLLLLLAGLERAASGRIRVGPHQGPGREKRFREVAALAMQDADLQILGSTVEEDLFLGRNPRDEAARMEVLAMAGRLGLKDLLERPVQALSHGQKRKLCLATALLATGGAPGDRLLLFDEPFSGLDYPSALEMRELLVSNKNAGHTQVVTAHDLEPVIDLVDSLAVLHAGKLQLHGAPVEVLDRVGEFGIRQPCSWRLNRGITRW